MFCHEGPWHKVDRIWTIRTDGSDLKLVHQRTMAMEIAGHEALERGRPDNLVRPANTARRGFLGGPAMEIATGARTWYHLPP